MTLQTNEKNQYLTKMIDTNHKLKEELDLKKVLFEQKKHRTETLYKKK